MKSVQLTFHFEFADAVERILDECEVREFVRVPMVEGRDAEGKHYGSQVHPGNVTLVLATVEDDAVDDLLDRLERFRNARKTHQHLRAIVLQVEGRLGEAREIPRED